jgi:hypothetical protein
MNMNTHLIVENYFNAMKEGRIDEMEQYVAKHQQYWISGGGSWEFGGFNTPETMGKLWSIVAQRFPKGLNITVKSILVDGIRRSTNSQSCCSG